MQVETITAIATPPGQGGVGIIRLSGPLAYAIALKLNGNQSLSPRVVRFCTFKNSHQEILDTGLALYFKAPHSFTGEDVVEFQVHGSPLALDGLLQECLHLGARIARPGEFSERAFLNDKIDLTQAEAIADLIQASSQTAVRMAIRSLQGDFSKLINEMNEEIINLRLYVEAAIDFPEEEIDFLADGQVAKQLTNIISKLAQVQREANQGAMIREGLSLVIVGRPNAGKSTLINRLANRDVAIVTAIPGTTRDVIRQPILLDDIPLHVIDTAGLRPSDDVVELEGIKRTWEEIKKADCVLMLIDINQPETVVALKESILANLPSEIPILHVVNKIDSLRLPAVIKNQTIYISAKTGEGLSFLKEQIKQVVGYQPAEGQFMARKRHLQALDEAMSYLKAGQRQLIEQRAGELLAEDLRLSHQALGEITGKFTSDDLLGRIFSSFCIGK